MKYSQTEITWNCNIYAFFLAPSIDICRGEIKLTFLDTTFYIHCIYLNK